MENKFFKECYDSNPHFKIHHTIEPGDKHTNPALLHYDDSYVLTYFKKGRGSIRIDGAFYEINEGDIILINPDELHLCTVESGIYHERIAVYIKSSLFKLFGISPSEFLNVFSEDNLKVINKSISFSSEYQLHTYFEKALETVKKQTQKSEICTLCILSELIYTLGEIPVPQNKETASMRDDPTIKAILKYLNENFKENITLENLSEEFFISKYHLSRLFKENVGTSIINYIVYKRILNFNSLIREGLSIDKAAFLSGFRNYSNFFKLYKKHMGISPRDYKLSLKK
ncbi:MAG: AraC family transcriptional regulator [Ruminococcaceae bacterium]|nr:AraC family transcriptional regulator [Oscillospiraceae bacterium]